MNKKMNPPGDDYCIRCPRLGHQIYFSYCRSENMGQPCFKILDCWFEHFPVDKYLRNELEPEEWEKVSVRHVKPKIQSLMDLVDLAKKNQ